MDSSDKDRILFNMVYFIGWFGSGKTYSIFMLFSQVFCLGMSLWSQYLIIRILFLNEHL